ncbi:2,3-diketo-L-gulonate TRAP transporter small permease protein YiaM [Vibrio spartinae]|uniref:TRAP transporter small permease protein n=2 Tax=Vibrio spartinae TaxID=1918945 RepID=A0A1N6MA85_9VIBR|nr:2,3-diketo-L-gulonate TRAP transporter small permease protein YiaM [Vibrio spartinae]SIO96313.1 2,3-diketo-L-gulonate TRAP transporter small permease protein YiaM [Vibrio spartinae]
MVFSFNNGDSMLRAIEKALNTVTTPLSKILRHMGGILLLVMTVIVVIQVLFRYILNIPLSWTDESSRFLMIYMTYLCLPFVYLTDKNIAMTFVTEILEKKTPRLFAFFALLAHISAIFVFIVWIKFGWNFFHTGAVMADSLPIPMYYIYVIPPVMMSVTLLFALQKCVSSLRNMFGDFEDISHTALTAALFEASEDDEDSTHEQQKTQPLGSKTA